MNPTDESLVSNLLLNLGKFAEKRWNQKKLSWWRSYQVVGADCLGGAPSTKTINVQPCGSGGGCRL